MEKSRIKWTHIMHLPNGEVTPGEWEVDPKKVNFSHVNFKNKRVLDIGCLDGAYTFMAESWGAKEVVSIDINDFNELSFDNTLNPTKKYNTGYLYAHKAFKSKAKYLFPYSVYNLDSKKLGKFDIVLFLGVFYHLAHPLYALERINEVMKKDGILIMETEISFTHTKFYHKNRFKHQIKAPKRLVTSSSRRDFLASSLNFFLRRPIKAKMRILSHLFYARSTKFFWDLFKGLFYDKREIYNGDTSNFWSFDKVNLRRQMDFAGFQIISEDDDPLLSRTTFIAKKNSEIDNIYSYKY